MLGNMCIICCIINMKQCIFSASCSVCLFFIPINAWGYDMICDVVWLMLLSFFPSPCFFYIFLLVCWWMRVEHGVWEVDGKLKNIYINNKQSEHK